MIYFKRSGAVLGLIIAVMVLVPGAQADLLPYELNPTLSLTADPACQTSAVDPVPDPGCPYPAPPAGPTQRFDEPRAIALDFYGNEYVTSGPAEEGSILVFDDEGFFITQFAAPYSKSIAIDSEGNVYAFATDGSVVRFEPSAYDPEAGDIAYEDPAVAMGSPGAVGALAVDKSNDHLFITVPKMVLEYGSAKEGNPSLPTSEPEKLGNWTESIAIDSQRRRLFVSFCKSDIEDCGILVLDADDPNTELEEITGSTTPKGDFTPKLARLGIAVDEELGYLFVQDFSTNPGAIYQFGEDYEYLSAISDSRLKSLVSLQIAVSNGERPPASGKDAFNRHFLFVPTLPSSGQLGNRALAYEPPSEQPPEIEEVSATGIGETQAQLRALINPRGSDTKYRFDITTQSSFEEKGFEGAEIAGEGIIPGASLATQVSVPISGLIPGETYRFRAVAENGIGKADEEGQNEGTFTTYADAPVSPLCVNREMRFGAAARLPDCRAYELVTPPDTNGRAPRGTGFSGVMFPTILASPDGEAVSFNILGGSLPDSSGVGSFEGDPYASTRGPSGWTTALRGPTGDEATKTVPLSNSLDQGHIFWQAEGEGEGPAVIEGQDTKYIFYPDGHSELVGRGTLGTDPIASGRLITENGTHVLYESSVQLEPDAPPTGTAAVYDRTPDEVTHVVSLLPGDVTPAAGQNATYRGASKDGEGIAFTIGGKLYLRVGNETTYEIGENVEFAGVSEGGGRIFYVEGGDLEAFDSSTEEVLEFSTSGDVTPVNVATEGTRAYFVSPSVLGGANPLGEEAQAGEQNLYLSEEGAISFVATVTEGDVEGEPNPKGTTLYNGLGLWTQVLSTQPARDPSRLNPDGSVLLFQSHADITGYPESKSFPQIYRYDSTGDRLHCISCIPTGAPATGGASFASYAFELLNPPPFSLFSFTPNLTPDGDRVIFESKEALVSYDTDEVQDVYEWEENKVGNCTQPGGCVYLISSGTSERDNFLYAHSQSGNDVFFTTGDILNGFDGSGTTSIYDARVNGGFAEDEGTTCVDEGCLLPLTPPPAMVSPAPPTPGDGNVRPGTKPHSCPKGKRKVKKNGKVRCVKKKKHKAKGGKAKQRAGANREAGK